MIFLELFGAKEDTNTTIYYSRDTFEMTCDVPFAILMNVDELQISPKKRMSKVKKY